MKNILLIVVLMLATINGAIAREERVEGYTKKNGKEVKAYTREVKDTVKDKDPDTVEVKGYTKKDGTKVAGYTRKKPKAK